MPSRLASCTIFLKDAVGEDQDVSEKFYFLFENGCIAKMSDRVDDLRLK